MAFWARWRWRRRTWVATVGPQDVLLLTSTDPLTEQQYVRLRESFASVRTQAAQGDGPFVLLLEPGLRVAAVLRTPWAGGPAE